MKIKQDSFVFRISDVSVFSACLPSRRTGNPRSLHFQHCSSPWQSQAARLLMPLQFYSNAGKIKIKIPNKSTVSLARKVLRNSPTASKHSWPSCQLVLPSPVHRRKYLPLSEVLPLNNIFQEKEKQSSTRQKLQLRITAGKTQTLTILINNAS